jgi:hypothetical protein
MEWRLILRAGALNAVLATVMAAAALALFGGAGAEDRVATVGVGKAQRTEQTHSWHPLELAEAALWLCPFTAITCGSFGLLAGIAGSGLMCLRARRIRSTKRFVAETAILGFALGCLFVVRDGWAVYWQQIPFLSFGALEMLGPPFGGLCAFLCALSFRKRFLAGAENRVPSTSGK